VEYINFTENRGQWPVLVNTAMDVDSVNSGKFLD
jgi:hypothetical protein